MGARVGSVSTAGGTETLVRLVCEEKIDAGLGAWDNSAHPIRKDSTLVMVNQIRKANFSGFMDDSFLEAVTALQELDLPVLGDADDAALLQRYEHLLEDLKLLVVLGQLRIGIIDLLCGLLQFSLVLLFTRLVLVNQFLHIGNALLRRRQFKIG